MSSGSVQICVVSLHNSEGIKGNVMHYEVYIDILFFTNFMMDFLLLLTVRQILKYRVPVWRVLVGSILGSGLTCLIVVFPLSGISRLILNFLGISTVMLVTGLAVHTLREWGKAMGVLFISAFLEGGILQAFYPYLRTGSLFFAAAVASYMVISGCWKLLLSIRNNRKRICEVTLFFGGESRTFRALIDTGNRLVDPVSKEPVHVVDGRTAGIIGVKNMHTFRYLPYSTVSGSGVMPVIRIEKMCVRAEQEQWIQKPVIGICKELISGNGEYQMILNADIF